MEDRPGKNGGGKLKSGNTKNVGRLRKEVKLAHVELARHSLSHLRKIIAQKPCIPVPGRKNKAGRQLMRVPTFDEWKWAVEQVNRYGVGTSVELGGDDDAAAVKVVYKFE